MHVISGSKGDQSQMRTTLPAIDGKVVDDIRPEEDRFEYPTTPQHEQEAEKG